MQYNINMHFCTTDAVTAYAHYWSRAGSQKAMCEQAEASIMYLGLN